MPQHLAETPRWHRFLESAHSLRVGICLSSSSTPGSKVLAILIQVVAETSPPWGQPGLGPPSPGDAEGLSGTKLQLWPLGQTDIRKNLPLQSEDLPGTKSPSSLLRPACSWPPRRLTGATRWARAALRPPRGHLLPVPPRGLPLVTEAAGGGGEELWKVRSPSREGRGEPLPGSHRRGPARMWRELLASAGEAPGGGRFSAVTSQSPPSAPWGPSTVTSKFTRKPLNRWSKTCAFALLRLTWLLGTGDTACKGLLGRQELRC